MADVLIELYRELTDLLPGRKVPECWPDSVHSLPVEFPDGYPEDERVVAWCDTSKMLYEYPTCVVCPDLSQVKALIESLEWRQHSGTWHYGIGKLLRRYYSTITKGDHEIDEFGDTELIACLRALIAALKT